MTATITTPAGPVPAGLPLQSRRAPAPESGPFDGLSVTGVLELLPSLATFPPPTGRRNRSKRADRSRGTTRILDWLLTFPGDGWQERWILSGADRSVEWIDQVTAGYGRIEATRRETTTEGLGCVLLARVVRPSYEFLQCYRSSGLYRHAKQEFGAELFHQVRQAGMARGVIPSQLSTAENSLVKVSFRTGRDLARLTADDLIAYHEWHRRTFAKAPAGLHSAWDLLRDVGVLAEGLSLRRTLARGPLSTAELVDRYGVQPGPVRDLFVRYLDERRPSLDYSSLSGLASQLVGAFWADIEKHHPGISNLHLAPEVAEAWKQRVKVITREGKAPVPRENWASVLASVRAFYLDITEWALEDPNWAAWAAPSPVRRCDTGGFTKVKKKARAKMHQRVRERLPRLPELVDATEQHHADQQQLLSTADATPVGETFTHDGRHYRRIDRKQDRSRKRFHYRPTIVLAEDLATGEQLDLTRGEDEAFWAWAVIETLRHTGIRLEELLELTHLALVSYQLSDTGEIVPLLQIVPSKSNEERLLLVSPDLASVLATVISRLRRDNDGIVPLVARYDPHELVTGPTLPHLFQRRVGWKRDVITTNMVYQLLNDTLSRAALTDPTGQPLRYTPHDFRRIFATEAVAGGLPVHIAARLLGHASLTTTEAYVAVFQDELIRSYRAFLDQRRAVRPAEEYREPTDDEWREFQQHFQTRKLELGDCARPYGTPCQHEHSCLRCPMLRVSPRQRPRLVEIIRNLGERIEEARMNGWLGEVQGLRVSLTKAREKLTALDRSLERAHGRSEGGITDLGMPVITTPRRAPG
ncbi:tyrosine-type recombinase/integrase [Kitasatospora sp. NPDC001175]|uniref:tyrosine-type recombinase/integrase n=1 Tax=Kitasatospora sp. NPDC001175 TaxID=3157103 RepID=UPI003D065B0A